MQDGFTSIDEVAYVPESELLEIEDFDENNVTELRQRARDALLTQLIAAEEQLDQNKPAQDLLDLEGMTDALAFRLAEQDIRTRDDLAECSVDEIEHLRGFDAELAADMIKIGRASCRERG